LDVEGRRQDKCASIKKQEGAKQRFVTKTSLSQKIFYKKIENFLREKININNRRRENEKK
jgi:hypothetical protein